MQEDATVELQQRKQVDDWWVIDLIIDAASFSSSLHDNDIKKNDIQNIIQTDILSHIDIFEKIAKPIISKIMELVAPFLKYALEGEEALNQFVEAQIKGLALAYNYLTLKENA